MEIIYFLIASFLVVIVPGPTVSLIIANSLKSGTRAGILNVAGTQLGLIILIVQEEDPVGPIITIMAHTV